MSATRAFALRSTLRAACNRPIQSQARIALGRRGYASVQEKAHHAAHKAGGDLPWYDAHHCFAPGASSAFYLHIYKARNFCGYIYPNTGLSSLQ
ncbi:hypothetical protein CONLIGDRAFT_632294 [Coniochaeta ligniaria NRRL 30616]|uniref:Uncharacterized protein n=1 Tax=Coniochaeta ligniaria NRRL 30616 TaxID=1408157 RepID=A0A1J7ISC6_9PEZI|nr:hypothetical protein CONLIGDRAFT_632294 [Coniochaeta ligniaria NRRL 30616]